MATRFACAPFLTADQLLDGSCACSFDAADDEELIEDMIDAASDLMSIMTAGVMSGVCRRSVRPVAARACSVPSSYGSHPAPYFLPDHTTRYGGVNTVPLRGPNVNVIEVVIDGVVLNPSEYGLFDGRNLYRRNGDWPTENNLTKHSTEVGTWEITYEFGWAPDRLARLACLELACELVKDDKGRPNALPRGVTSVNVQGATANLRDRAEALREGVEQIPSLARFLSVWAPDGMNTRSGVWAPELDQFWHLVEVEGPSGS
jgi:hypothetical protein